MSKPRQKKCKRGHLLEHNRYTVKTKHKATGVESGCRLCKGMRNALQREREYFRSIGRCDLALSINKFAVEYFKEGLR